MGIKTAEPSAEPWNDFPVDIEAVIARLDEVVTPAEAANRRTAAPRVRGTIPDKQLTSEIGLSLAIPPAGPGLKAPRLSGAASCCHVQSNAV